MKRAAARWSTPRPAADMLHKQLRNARSPCCSDPSGATGWAAARPGRRRRARAPWPRGARRRSVRSATAAARPDVQGICARQAPEEMERPGRALSQRRRVHRSSAANTITASRPRSKNLLDHFLEEYFWRPRASSATRPASFGGVRAAMQLRMTLAELGMPSVPSIFPIPRIADAISEDGKARRTGHRTLDEQRSSTSSSGTSARSPRPAAKARPTERYAGRMKTMPNRDFPSTPPAATMCRQDQKGGRPCAEHQS